MSGFVKNPSGSRWQLTDPVAGELRDLKDAALLQRVMNQLRRYEAGEALVDGGSTKNLGSGLMELRQDWDGNTTYRLIFAHPTGRHPVILALHFFKKKSSQGISTPRHHITVAENRLKDWLKNAR